MTTPKTTYTPRTTAKGTEIVRNTDRMAAKAATHAVDDLGQGDYVVGSGESGEIYEVTVSEIASVMAGATQPTLICTCTCDYGTAVQHGSCSHTVAAVAKWLGARVRLYSSPEAAGRSHRAVRYIGDGIWVSPR
jgi:hypothetical protein